MREGVDKEDPARQCPAGQASCGGSLIETMLQQSDSFRYCCLILPGLKFCLWKRQKNPLAIDQGCRQPIRRILLEPEQLLACLDLCWRLRNDSLKADHRTRFAQAIHKDHPLEVPGHPIAICLDR